MNSLAAEKSPVANIASTELTASRTAGANAYSASATTTTAMMTPRCTHTAILGFMRPGAFLPSRQRTASRDPTLRGPAHGRGMALMGVSGNGAYSVTVSPVQPFMPPSRV